MSGHQRTAGGARTHDPNEIRLGPRTPILLCMLAVAVVMAALVYASALRSRYLVLLNAYASATVLCDVLNTSAGSPAWCGDRGDRVHVLRGEPSGVEAADASPADNPDAPADGQAAGESASDTPDDAAAEAWHSSDPIAVAWAASIGWDADSDDSSWLRDELRKVLPAWEATEYEGTAFAAWSADPSAGGRSTLELVLGIGGAQCVQGGQADSGPVVVAHELAGALSGGPLAAAVGNVLQDDAGQPVLTLDRSLAVTSIRDPCEVDAARHPLWRFLVFSDAGRLGYEEAGKALALYTGGLTVTTRDGVDGPRFDDTYARFAAAVIGQIDASDTVRAARTWVLALLGPEQFAILVCVLFTLMVLAWRIVGLGRRHDAAVRPRPGSDDASAQRWFDLARDAAHHERAPIRIVQVAIPTIGFIGTVRGIMLALNDASLLVASGAPLAQQAAVTDVTSTLALAFATTLVALLAGLVLLPITTLEERATMRRVDRIENVLLHDDG